VHCHLMRRQGALLSPAKSGAEGHHGDRHGKCGSASGERALDNRVHRLCFHQTFSVKTARLLANTMPPGSVASLLLIRKVPDSSVSTLRLTWSSTWNRIYESGTFYCGKRMRPSTTGELQMSSPAPKLELEDDEQF